MENIKDRLNENLEISKKICEELNKQAENNHVRFEATASNCDVGVRQVLDTRGLQYNEIYFKDSIKTKSMDKIIDLVTYCLASGRFNAVYPSSEEIKLYDRFEKYDWLNDIYVDKDVIYIEGEELYIPDIVDIEIDKDHIEVIECDGTTKYKTTIKRGLNIESEEMDNIKTVPFYISCNEEADDLFIKDMNKDDIVFATTNGGLVYVVNNELHFDDEIGDSIICEFDSLEKITYIARDNEYMIKFKNYNNETEYGYFNKYGFEM